MVDRLRIELLRIERRNGNKTMTVEQLRILHQARPFRPFTIRMADGSSHHVPHSEFLSQSPSGRTIIVHRPDDTYSVVDLLLVTELTVDGSPTAAEPS
jgi:hypothetical protein